jgi:hypothetical protein
MRFIRHLLEVETMNVLYWQVYSPEPRAYATAMPVKKVAKRLSLRDPVKMRLIES